MVKKFEIGDEKNNSLFDAWFERTGITQVPFIVVRKKRKYCDVNWDHANLDPVFDHLFAGVSESFKEGLISIFNKYADKKSEYTITNLTLYAEKIPLENGEAFADELFDYINGVLFDFRHPDLKD